MADPPAGPQPKSDTLAPGTVFGKYTLTGEIGRGSMGVVYDAQDLTLHRRVALKVMNPSRGVDPKEAMNDWQRFMQEARLTANLAKHPNIVTVYEAAVQDSRRYIAMEHVAGEPMKSWRKGRSPAEQIRLIRDVALAVHHAHEHGIIHRDLKPANVLVAKGSPVVTDFGLARIERRETNLGLTPRGYVVGSPAYMSPEQAKGEAEVGRTTDVYSLGVMIYEAIAGKPPFEGKNALETLSKVAEGAVVPPSKAVKLESNDAVLEKICLKAMALNPADRYPTAQALAEDLSRWLDSKSTFRRSKPQRISLVLVAGAVGGLVFSFLGAVLYHHLSKGRPEPPRKEPVAVKSASPSATFMPTEIVVPLTSFKPDFEDQYNTVTPTRITFQRPFLFEAPVTLPESGDYEISVVASCDPARNEFARFDLSIDRKVEATFELRAKEPEEYRHTVRISMGPRKLAIKFTNDYYDARTKEDRNLYVHKVILRRIR